MKSDNRWLYIGGVALLVIIVVVGFTMRDRDGDQDSSPDGSLGADGDMGDASGDGSASEGDSATEDATVGGEPVEVGDVPSDPEACRAYCRDLAERGALASGTDAARCISSLCSGAEGGDAEEESALGEELPTITEPDVPEMPDDCQAQCRLLQQRGELREGTSLEDCFAALCESE